MKQKVLSVETISFKSKKDGKDKTFWKCYFMASNGAVGAVMSFTPHAAGDEVNLVLSVRDGNLIINIAD